jgi:hypothetical protein
MGWVSLADLAHGGQAVVVRWMGDNQVSDVADGDIRARRWPSRACGVDRVPSAVDQRVAIVRTRFVTLAERAVA